ncbi:MAG: phospholipase D-like domain-containing protein, partial [Patescibacteria group bacterium]
VEVEIIMPRFALHPVATNIPNYFYMHKLYKHGVKFFLTKGMNHSKIMLVDGHEGILGSQNVDILSFDFNMESGVFFTDPGLIRELYQITEDWKKDSVIYSPQMREKYLNYLLDHFLNFSFNFFEQAVKYFNKLTRTLSS